MSKDLSFVQVFNSGSFFVYFVHSYQGDDDDDDNNNNNKPGFPPKSDCRATGRGDILVLMKKGPSRFGRSNETSG